MLLKDYEEQILRRMFDENIIMNKYKPTEMVRSKIRWSELRDRYHIRKKFETIMHRMETGGYVTSHGKSGQVYSLAEFGVYYVRTLNHKWLISQNYERTIRLQTCRNSFNPNVDYIWALQATNKIDSDDLDWFVFLTVALV